MKRVPQTLTEKRRDRGVKSDISFYLINDDTALDTPSIGDRIQTSRDMNKSGKMQGHCLLRATHYEAESYPAEFRELLVC